MMKPRLYFFAGALLSLALAVSVVASDKVKITRFHGTDTLLVEAFKKSGKVFVNATITSATADASGKVTVNFAVKDSAGKGLAGIKGVNFSLATALMGKGMLLLGALGASVGIGIQQAMQMTGCQGLGFISGEWRGVHGRPRTQMYWAIGVLMIAAAIMVIGKKLGAS